MYTIVDVEIKVNIKFSNLKYHKDSEKREEHLIDRMALRGISVENIKEAIQKGPKKFREDKAIIAEFGWFKVVYREFRINEIRKIYPITVLEAE